jgi:branched-chain amino acid transport system ATP-binding protein
MRYGYGAADILQDCTILRSRRGRRHRRPQWRRQIDRHQGHLRHDGPARRQGQFDGTTLITALPPQARVEAGMGMVPQTNNVFPGMTVEENLQMGAFLREDGGAGHHRTGL